MKKLLLMLVIFAGIVYSQQFPISAFKMYSSVDAGVPPHATQLQKTFPLMQDAYFNYGMPFTRNLSDDAQINQLLDSAAVHNIKIILPDVVDKYSALERFYIDASDVYFSYRHGDFVSPPDPDAEQPNPNFYDHTSLKATFANDYMVKDVKYQPVHPWYSNLNYTAYFRLKVSRSGSPPPTTPIVDIEVWDNTTGLSYSKRTLLSQDFATDNTYYSFSIPFNSREICYTTSSPSPSLYDDTMPLDYPPSVNGTMTTVCYPHSFDFRVKWLGTIQVWLDNIRVDGSFNTGLNSISLFSNGYDPQIKLQAKKFNNKTALARFYLKDEPYITQYLAADKVNKVLRIAAQENGVDPSTGKSLGYTAKVEDNPVLGTYFRYTHEVTPYELATDIYRFTVNDPLQNNPNYTNATQDILQSAVVKFILANQNSVYAESGNWWYFPNIGTWIENNAGSREPYINEIKAQVNLALAYGCKGIHYFHYWSNDLRTGISNSRGLIDPTTCNPLTDNGYGENKWEGIKSINQKLSGALGTTLMNLTWQNAFSIYQGQPTSTYITSITTSDAANERYVELGFFNDVLNNDYFMLVNRRTKNTESRDITVTFNKSSSYTTWKVSEIGTNNIWIVSKTGSFQTTYSPGEGKLFKFEPLFLNSSETFSGNVYVNNSLTISAGKTLTIQQGTTLKFNSSSSLIVNGTLNAVGTSSESIKFTSQSGTTNSSWGTITLSGSGAAGSIIKYANVKYGTKVEAINTSNITIQYCNIDTTYDGIRFNNSSGSILNNKITSNSIGHGIVIESGSTNVTVNDNVIKKTYTDRRGVGIYFGGGAGGNAARNDIYGWDWGICAIWSSSPSSQWEYYPDRNNRIRNCNTGFMVYRLSYPMFGIPPQIDLGYNMNNSISGNSYNAKVGTSYSTYASGLNAYSNWWGSYPPNTSLFQVGSLSWLAYGYYLQNDPWAGLQKIASEFTNEQMKNPTTLTKTNQTETSVIDLLLYGIELRLQDKFNDAKNYFMSYLADHPDNQQAYVELYNCYSKETADEIIKFFSSLPEKASKDHKLLLSYLYLKNGDFKNAKEVNNSIIAENPNTVLATKAKLNNVYIALYNEDNINEAITIFNYALSKSKLSTTIELSQVHNAIETYGKTYGKEINGLAALPNFESSEQDLVKQEGLNKIGVPDKYQLLGNYPNPFNPSTTISYALPYQSSVEIIIYDLMGKEIKSFTVPSQSAGYNRLVWDGKNESGNPVTSGVYFYRISIKSLENNETFVKTAKMLMLK